MNIIIEKLPKGLKVQVADEISSSKAVNFI